VLIIQTFSMPCGARERFLTDAVAWRNADTIRAFVAAAGSAMVDRD
jgi:hypothetical protein